MEKAIRIRLTTGNQTYIQTSNQKLRMDTAENGQHPMAIVICCSDSRVIPEQIFSAEIGDLFVIRIAGNVLDNHQIGSVEYAASHLHCSQVILLGHTGCGAIASTLAGGGEGYIKYITDDIASAIGDEKDPDKACVLNVEHGINRLRTEFSSHPEISSVNIQGAIYDIRSGEVRWL